MFKRKQEPFHDVQIIAMFLFLTIIVLSTVVLLFQSLFRVPKTHSH